MEIYVYEYTYPTTHDYCYHVYMVQNIWTKLPIQKSMESYHYVINWMYDFNSFVFRLAVTELRRESPHWKCNIAIARQTKASVCCYGDKRRRKLLINQWIK